MAVQIVFSDNLNPSAVNLSSRFSRATAFYIDLPLIGAELEIDVFLQVYVESVIGEIARNVPLGRISESSILLNKIDTEILQFIPTELQNTGLEMALLFVPASGETSFLYAYVIQPDCNLCTIDNKLDLISDAIGVIIPPTPVTATTSTFNSLFALGFF